MKRREMRGGVSGNGVGMKRVVEGGMNYAGIELD